MESSVVERIVHDRTLILFHELSSKFLRDIAQMII